MARQAQTARPRGPLRSKRLTPELPFDTIGETGDESIAFANRRASHDATVLRECRKGLFVLRTSASDNACVLEECFRPEAAFVVEDAAK